MNSTANDALILQLFEWFGIKEDSTIRWINWAYPAAKLAIKEKLEKLIFYWDK